MSNAIKYKQKAQPENQNILQQKLLKRKNELLQQRVNELEDDKTKAD